MPWGPAIAAVGTVAGAAISSSNSPSSSGGSGGPNYYTPTGLQGADTTWQQLLAQQQAQQGGIEGMLPYYQQAFQQGINANNQYAHGYQNAANAAGQQYAGVGLNALAMGQRNYDNSMGLAGAGQQLYQTAFDPQSALYNRTVQQLQDQTGATNSMYGLGSSAAGAGVANQALSNFNIDWQNQQLQRQATGLQGLGAAYGQAGQLAGQGAALQGTGAGYTLQSGQLPYQTAQGIAAYPGQLAGQYASGIESGPLSSAQAINSQIIPYLNYGQGAQAIPYQNQAQGAGALGALASQGISSLGSNPQVQSALGGAFGGNSATGSFGGGDFSGAFTSSPYYSGGGNSYGFTT
jgi:hypothetical protein